MSINPASAPAVEQHAPVAQYMIGRAVTKPRKTIEWVLKCDTREGAARGLNGIHSAEVRFTIQRHIAKKFTKADATAVMAHLPAGKGWTIYRAGY